MDIFNEQSAVLVRKLSREINKDSFNIFPYVTLCTLDIVCGEFFRKRRFSPMTDLSVTRPRARLKVVKAHMEHVKLFLELTLSFMATAALTLKKLPRAALSVGLFHH
jgi:hypothetical protein